MKRVGKRARAQRKMRNTEERTKETERERWRERERRRRRRQTGRQIKTNKSTQNQKYMPIRDLSFLRLKTALKDTKSKSCSKTCVYNYLNYNTVFKLSKLSFCKIKKVPMSIRIPV